MNVSCWNSRINWNEYSQSRAGILPAQRALQREQSVRVLQNMAFITAPRFIPNHSILIRCDLKIPLRKMKLLVVPSDSGKTATA
jgi:hypothetical protein